MDQVNQTADFRKTLERMYQSSRILYEKGQYYNCCYLCGYILECALKYILLKYAKTSEGVNYTVNDIKSFQHNTSKLNKYIDDWISISGTIDPAYRMNCHQMCPYIFEGRMGYPLWNPSYRYGEHAMWSDREYCRKYIEESESIFQFIAGLMAEGRIQHETS